MTYVSKVIVKVVHTETRGHLPLLTCWSFLGTTVISRKHLVGPLCYTRESLEAWTHARGEEDVGTRKNFMEIKAVEVTFGQNAPFSECLLELYKWWLYLASGRTQCP